MHFILFYFSKLGCKNKQTWIHCVDSASHQVCVSVLLFCQIGTAIHFHHLLPLLNWALGRTATTNETRTSAGGTCALQHPPRAGNALCKPGRCFHSGLCVVSNDADGQLLECAAAIFSPLLTIRSLVSPTRLIKHARRRSLSLHLPVTCITSLR